MRILTGQYKGRAIKMPKGIRPTQDKVRKAIFDILGDIEGLSFLELFSGSGAVGFEAVSRGVSELVLVEHSRDCQMAIRKNISSLGLKACTLYPREVERAIKALHRQKREFDIIFLDPPYYNTGILRRRKSDNAAAGSGLMEYNGNETLKKTLQTLSAYDILAPDGFLIIQHFKRSELPEAIGSLNRLKQARYGDTVLSFYKKTV